LGKRQHRSNKAAAGVPRQGRRRVWIVGLAVVVAAGAGMVLCWAKGIGPWHAGLPGRLNVLLITADTTRADYLGCYGGKAITPNMDSLAREGTLFRRCSTSVVLTTPSHCTIMTGLYPFIHGVRRNGEDHLPDAATTLAEVFKEVGFGTAASVGSYVLDPRFGLAQGFDAYRSGLPQAGSADTDAAERKGDKVCDDALALLRERARQRFFLWAHFYDPHYPYESRVHTDIGSAAAYADEIAFMDAQIGRLLDALRQLGLERNTLVVLVGDHGEGLDDHGEFQHGYFAYETCQHVPLLMRCPGVIPAGRQIAELVRTVDLAPTILELADLPALPEVSGVSVAPLLSGRSTGLQIGAYCETLEPYTVLRLSRVRTFTEEKWKYIWSPGPRLFDLETDPGELKNVIGEHPDTAASLRERLRVLIAESPPRIPPDKAKALNSAEIARLESLGYVGTASPDSGDSPELDTFEPREPDPHTFAAVIRAYQDGWEALRSRLFAKAEGRMREVLAVLPDAPVPQRDLAQALWRQGKLEEAARCYELALSAMPSDLRMRGDYAMMLMDAGQWEQVILQATEILRTAPDDFVAHVMLGAAYEKLGRLDDARQHLEAATRLQPAYAGTIRALGDVYMKQRRFAEAAECFRRMLALQPRSTIARERLEAAERELRAGRRP
jgi:arylsulfatase A-like enzyme/Tfp pilus assembly protein PilF